MLIARALSLSIGPDGPFRLDQQQRFCLAMPQQTNYHDEVENCPYYLCLDRATISK